MVLKNKMKGLLFRFPRPIKTSFYKVYNRIKYPNMMEKKVTYGDKNPNNIIYIIRPRTDGIEGLMALFLNVVKQVNYANQKGYYPVVDFKNYYTQYKDESRDDDNVWEYYFKPVSEISLADAYCSKNVILSGLSGLSKSEEYLDQQMDSISINHAREFISQYFMFSNTVTEYVKKEISNIEVDKTLGLYLRGTDYIKLRPSGHPIQPSVGQAILKAEEIMRRQKLSYIFLVTEDADIYQEIKNHFGEKLIIVSYDSFISEYNGSGFLSQNENSITQLAETPYKRGMNYLVKLIILSKCKCFVGGNTCGSWASQVFSKGFDESYIFDLGIYN